MPYRVVKDFRAIYVSPFDLEMYVREGFDVYKPSEEIINDIDSEMETIAIAIEQSSPKKYYARKDGVSFQIQPLRIPEFYNRGYEIYIPSWEKVEDPQSEVLIANATMVD